MNWGRADHEKLRVSVAHILPVVPQGALETEAVARLQEVGLLSDGELHLPLDAELKLLPVMVKIPLFHASPFGDGQEDGAEALTGQPTGQRLDADFEVWDADRLPLPPRKVDDILCLGMAVQERLEARPQTLRDLQDGPEGRRDEIVLDLLNCAGRNIDLLTELAQGECSLLTKLSNLPPHIDDELLNHVVLLLTQYILYCTS